MGLPPKFITSIRKDLQLVLQMLRKSEKEYSLDDPKELASEIYRYYRSHSKEEFNEELTLAQEKLRWTMIALNSLGLFKSEFAREKDTYVRFYSWDTTRKDDEEIVNSCTVRIYLNPQLVHFQDVLVDLVLFYSKLKPNWQSPLMFKMPLWINLKPATVERSDKIIFYANPQNKLVERLLARIKTYPANYFNQQTPLFTNKIRDGVGVAYEPKEDNFLVRHLRKITGRQDIFLSYGTYMSNLIADCIQRGVIMRGIRKKGQLLQFNLLDEQQIITIGTTALIFILERVKVDLELA